MFEITKVSPDEVSGYSHLYYCGWSEEELKNYEMDCQTIFLGTIKDAIFKIVMNDTEVYHIVFRAGESLRSQVRWIFETSQSTLVVHVNGNIYRFHLLHRQYLDSHCYAKVLFDNTSNMQNLSPFLLSEVSPDEKMMVVIDTEGVAVLNWEKVLWKRSLEWAYADYVRIREVSNSSVVIFCNPPDENKKQMAFDIFTGIRMISNVR